MKLTITIWLACALLLFAAGFWAGQRSWEETREEVFQDGYRAAQSDYASDTHAKVFEDGRKSAFSQVSVCTLEYARREECWIPCRDDADCIAKNGKGDH